MKKNKKRNMKPRNWVALLLWETRRGHKVIPDAKKEAERKKCRRKVIITDG